MRVKRQLLFVQGGGKGTHDEWDNKRSRISLKGQKRRSDSTQQYPRTCGQGRICLELPLRGVADCDGRRGPCVDPRLAVYLRG